MAIDPRAVMAARNNADLYEAVFRLHGVDFERLPFAFVAKGAPPPYYSDLTILEPDRLADVWALLAGIAARSDGRMGVKDSFLLLDIEANGFRELFGASWIWCAARVGAVAPWERVETARDLELWEAAWKAGGSPTERRMFGEGLLEMPEIGVFGQRQGDEFVAGCIGNLSGDCVGLSNLFGGGFEAAAASVGTLGPGLPIVGYEAGADLDLARAAGFDLTGGLRILLAECAEF